MQLMVYEEDIRVLKESLREINGTLEDVDKVPNIPIGLDASEFSIVFQH